MPFDRVHSDIMNAALSPLGFQPEAIKDVDEGAASQDDIKSWKMFEETHHFDGNNIVGGYDYVRSQIKNSINSAGDCYKDANALRETRFKLGEAYHALQDFYSHSNWLEMCLYNRETPTVFRWDMHSAFDERNAEGGSAWYTAPLRNMPAELKTGYFTNAEIGAAGLDVAERTLPAPLNAEASKQLRTLMVKEAVEKHSGLTFAPESLYQERINGRDSFYRALAYVVDDSKRALLHWEINKDDDKQIEGGMRAPTGETLHELAKQLAIKDTQLFWQAHVERLLWLQYGDKANFIIPAFKGNPLPELVLNLNKDRVTVRVLHLTKPVKQPLRVVLRAHVDQLGSKEIVLEFKTDEEQSLDLNTLIPGLAEQPSPFQLVVDASYQADANFRPVSSKLDFAGKQPVLAMEKRVSSTSSVDKSQGRVGDTFVLSADFTITGATSGAEVSALESSTVQQIDGESLPLAQSSERLKTSSAAPMAARKAWTFIPTRAGVYDWTYRIEVPGFGSTTGSERIIVNPAKQIVVDGESIVPAAGPNGPTLTLRVNYHIVGLSGTDSVNVRKESTITLLTDCKILPANIDIVSSGHSTGVLQNDFLATTPGDYEWTYIIDAGAIGRIQQSLPVHIDASLFPVQSANVGQNNALRDFEVMSATVTPPTDPSGGSFQLDVRYRALNLAANETASVEENDYVNFAGKTQSHPTSTRTVGQVGEQIKLASFVSNQPGRHDWRFTLTAPGFRTYYGSVPFDVSESDAASLHALAARLESNEIVIAPGETKNSNISISGFRSDSAEPVEIVFPQIADGWGSLPGQIQVFPGNERLLPQNMRGAGDYTKTYIAGKGYRARETAPPGVTPVKIMVRQKGAGEVVLTLLVRVVKKGEFSTNNSATANNSGNANKSSSTSNATSTTSGTAASTAKTAPPSITGKSSSGPSGAAADTKHQVVYHFKKATVAVLPVAGITGTGYSPLSDSQPVMTDFSTTNVSIPVSWNESKPGRAGLSQQSCGASVDFSFPKTLTLQSYQSDPTAFTGDAQINCRAKCTSTRSGPSSAFNSGPFGLFAGEANGAGVTNNARTKDSRSSYFSGGATFNLNWEARPMVIERASIKGENPAHQSTLVLESLGETALGIGGNDPGFTARVVLPQRLEYVTEAGTNTADQETDNTVKCGQVIARLEPSRIVLEAGKLPGAAVNILLENWRRDTTEAIEITYPGLGAMNMLPNKIRAVYAGGSQSPDALSRLQTDKGIYRWPQSFEAAPGATPGIYRVPLQVKQKGAAPCYLELEVEIISSKNLKFGNSTALFNKTPGQPAPNIWSKGWTPTANAVVPKAVPQVMPAELHKEAPKLSTAPNLFKRSGPFINMTQAPAGGGDWRIEVLGNNVKFTKLIFHGPGQYTEAVSVITFTLPPETISPGQTINMKASLSGAADAYGSGFWSMDGVGIKQTAHSQAVGPQAPNLTSDQVFLVGDCKGTGPASPWIQYNTMYNVSYTIAKCEILWRYERVK